VKYVVLAIELNEICNEDASRFNLAPLPQMLLVRISDSGVTELAGDCWSLLSCT